MATNKTRHVPPENNRPSGFAKIVYCPHCNTVAMYEDMHPARPCLYCGGRLSYNNFRGRWEKLGGGWFREEYGKWLVTSDTKAAIERLYHHYHSPTPAGVPQAKTDDFYDLDFSNLGKKP